MKKKMLSVVLSAAMATCILGGIPVYAKDYDQVTFAYATMNNVPSEEGLESVQEAVNEITREKIGVEVTLKPITLADYSQSVSLSLQGGVKIDIFQTIYNFSESISNGMLLDISDLIDEYGKETKELVGDEWLQTCTSDGSLYGIPVYKAGASKGYFVCREDILEEMGIDTSDITSPEDLTDLFAKVHEAYPDMTVLAPMTQGRLGENLLWENIDYLSDSDNQAFGVLLNDELKVQNLYDSELFEDNCNLIRDWYEAGYVMKDAATTTSSTSELFSSGNYFGTFTAHAFPTEALGEYMTALYGYPMKAIPISEPYITTSTINLVDWGIASNTKVPEAAMKFLNLTYTDPDVINLLIYGIEGRDYVLDEEGHAGYPEGADSTTVPYTAMMSSGIMGNSFIMHLSQGVSEEMNKEMEEANKTATTSPALGFSFDPSSVSVQYTAVSNVANQYLPGLLCGSVDPETELPKFQKALEDAGCQDIIEEKQNQLDAWSSAK